MTLRHSSSHYGNTEHRPLHRIPLAHATSVLRMTYAMRDTQVLSSKTGEAILTEEHVDSRAAIRVRGVVSGAQKTAGGKTCR